MSIDKIKDQAVCSDCGTTFPYTEQEHRLRDKMGIKIKEIIYAFPPAKQCPHCRIKRILSFTNERNFYYRECNAIGKKIISYYSPDKPHKVYSTDFWLSDKWDPLEYGKDFDFSKTFFEQFQELYLQVPRMSLDQGFHMENSEYNNYADNLKDCYNNAQTQFSERVHHSQYCFYNKDSIDCSHMYNSEKCYELVNAINCYNVHFSLNVQNSKDSYFLYDCKGVSDCMLSTNLRQKQYVILNQQLTKEAYFAQKEQLMKLLLDDPQAVKARFAEVMKDAIIVPTNNVNSENCTGEYLENCSNCEDLFIGKNAHNISHGYYVTNSRDCLSTLGDRLELGYYCFAGGDSYECAFSIAPWENCKNIYYSDYCFTGSEYLFGCIGLKRKKYCILNKQYTKEQFEELLPKIIQHMIKTGEWGEFFPATMSPFAYNESTAMGYFPLNKEEIERQGLKYINTESTNNKLVFVEDIKTNSKLYASKEMGQKVISSVLMCKKSNKPYRITQQELQFYIENNLPMPELCPDQRFIERSTQMNSFESWEKQCTAKGCSNKFISHYSPQRPGKVFCESCYLKTVY